MTTCPSIGDLLVGGRKVGLLHCSLPAGHTDPQPGACPECYHRGMHWDTCSRRDEVMPDLPGISHQAILEWADEPTLAQSWPDALDLDEQFDVDVDITTPEPLPDDGQG